MKTLHPVSHAYLDYLFSALFFLAPNVMDFSPDAANYSYLFGTLHLALSLFTQYQFGLVKAIPFATHGKIEIVESFLVFLLPWIVGFTNDFVGRNAFVVFGFALFGFWSLTDFAEHRSLIERKIEEISVEEDQLPPFRRAS